MKKNMMLPDDVCVDIVIPLLLIMDFIADI